MRIAPTLTTTEVARICRVAPRTVALWVDAGHLIGRWAGEDARHQRLISKEDFLTFLRANDMVCLLAYPLAYDEAWEDK